MHISTSHRFVLLANPKCGSQSIRRMVRRYCDIRRHRSMRGPSDSPLPRHPHSPARNVQRGLQELGYDWSEFTTITTIRNPWDRVVSCWHFADKTEQTKWRRLKEAAGGDFKRFCVDFPQDRAINVYAGDGNGALIVDHIVPIEAAGKRLPPIFEELGLPWRNLLHTNKSRDDSAYRDYYDDESRERIAAIFARDIEIGGYTF